MQVVFRLQLGGTAKITVTKKLHRIVSTLYQFVPFIPGIWFS